MLTLCNTVNLEEKGKTVNLEEKGKTVNSEEKGKGKIIYTGSSPDEVALVRAAKLLKFKLDERRSDYVTVEEVF